MFTKDTHQETGPVTLAQWMLLIVCAGIMNVTAFIGVGVFATHVTGFATLFGVHAADQRFGNAAAALIVPLFFLAGAMISGLCVEGRVRRDKLPHYDYVMILCSAALVFASWFGDKNNSDTVQTYLHIRKNFVVLSCICLASGLMNAAISYSSRATLRITHLTGITTDLGRGIAEIIALKRARKSEGLKKELRHNGLRFMLILSFIVGSLLGAYFFNEIGFNTLLIPAGYFAYAAWHGRNLKKL